MKPTLLALFLVIVLLTMSVTAAPFQPSSTTTPTLTLPTNTFTLINQTNETNESDEWENSHDLQFQTEPELTITAHPSLQLAEETSSVHFSPSLVQEVQFAPSKPAVHIPESDYYVYVGGGIKTGNLYGVGVFHPTLKMFIKGYPLFMKGSTTTQNDGRMVFSDDGRYIASTQKSGESNWIDVYDRYTNKTKKADYYHAYRYYNQVRYGPSDLFCSIQNRGSSMNPPTYIQAIGPDGQPRITISEKNDAGDRVISAADCAFTEDGKQLVISDWKSHSLLFFDIATQQQVASIPLGSGGRIERAGSTFFVRTADSFLIVENGHVARTLPYDNVVDDFVVNDVGSLIAIANYESNMITTIRTYDGEVKMQYWLGPPRSATYQCTSRNAVYLDFAPGDTLYATFCQFLYAIDTETHSIESWTLTEATHPIAVAPHDDFHEMVAPVFTTMNVSQLTFNALSSTPKDDATDVALNAQVAVQFDKKINPASANQHFYVSDNNYIQAYGNVHVLNKKLLFVPSENYKANTHYTISAVKGIKAEDGSELKETFKASFTTGTEEEEALTWPETSTGNDENESNTTLVPIEPPKPLLKKVGDFFKGIFGFLGR